MDHDGPDHDGPLDDAAVHDGVGHEARVLGDGTRAIHAGMPEGADGSPLGHSPVFASTYRLTGEPSGPYQYGRLTNPTWTAWEAALGELEGGDVISFASGIAAVSAVLLSSLRPGDVLVMAADCYYATRRLATGVLTEIGVAGAIGAGCRGGPPP